MVLINSSFNLGRNSAGVLPVGKGDCSITTARATTQARDQPGNNQQSRQWREGSGIEQEQNQAGTSRIDI